MSGSYSVEGEVYVIRPAKTISDKFSLQEFVIYVPGDYPQYIMLQCVNKKMEELRGVSVGMQVNARFNLRGREKEGPDGESRFWNSLDCWKIEPATDSDYERPPAPAPASGDAPF